MKKLIITVLMMCSLSQGAFGFGVEKVKSLWTSLCNVDLSDLSYLGELPADSLLGRAEGGADTGTQLSSATYIPEEVVPVGYLGLNDQTQLAQVSQHYRNAVSNHRKYLKYLSINSLEELKSFLYQDKYSSLTSLTIDLRHNNIEAAGDQDLANAIRNLTSLGSLGSLKSLTLDLDFNSIGKAGAQSLAAAIRELTSLTSLTLNIKKNYLGATEAQSLANAIRNLTSLTSLTLNIRFNSIGNAGALSLAAAIVELTSLTSLTLDLFFNNIGADGAQNLAAAIRRSTSLTTLTLNISANCIGDAGAQSLTDAIRRSTSLTSHNLYL